MRQTRVNKCILFIMQPFAQPSLQVTQTACSKSFAHCAAQIAAGSHSADVSKVAVAVNGERRVCDYDHFELVAVMWNVGDGFDLVSVHVQHANWVLVGLYTIKNPGTSLKRQCAHQDDAAARSSFPKREKLPCPY